MDAGDDGHLRRLGQPLDVGDDGVLVGSLDGAAEHQHQQQLQSAQTGRRFRIAAQRHRVRQPHHDHLAQLVLRPQQKNQDNVASFESDASCRVDGSKQWSLVGSLVTKSRSDTGETNAIYRPSLSKSK